MANETLVSLFTDIASAIRTKTGSSDTIVATNFPSAILDIPTGGGGETFYLNAPTVNVVDPNAVSPVFSINASNCGKYPMAINIYKLDASASDVNNYITIKNITSSNLDNWPSYTANMNLSLVKRAFEGVPVGSTVSLKAMAFYNNQYSAGTFQSANFSYVDGSIKNWGFYFKSNNNIPDTCLAVTASTITFTSTSNSWVSGTIAKMEVSNNGN